MELARAQITVNAIVPTAWTQMTETIPIYAPLVGRDEFPPEVRREHALGRPGGLRAAGRVPGLATRPRASPGRRSGSAATG